MDSKLSYNDKEALDEALKEKKLFSKKQVFGM
jgi:hypothetical protein